MDNVNLKQPKRRPLAVRVVMCCLALLALLVFSIWVGSWLGLFVVPFIVDFYITQKINWYWWRRCNNVIIRTVMSWVDAIVFALVAVYFINLYFFQNYVIPSSSLEKSLLTGDYLFVSKMSYGPRKPLTPIHMPLTSHTFPILNCQSYSELISWGYERVAGFDTIKLGDIVVFNNPSGDSVVINYQDQDYYSIAYTLGKEINAQFKKMSFKELYEKQSVLPIEEQLRQSKEEYDLAVTYFKQNEAQFGRKKFRPVDMREHYVKRCMGLPGQTLLIKNGVVYTNGKRMFTPKKVQFTYNVTLKKPIPEELRRELSITEEDISIKLTDDGNVIRMPLTKETKRVLEGRKDIVESIVPAEKIANLDLYPHSFYTGWDANNYGPIFIPCRGATISLTARNVALYERCIVNYEGNCLEVKDGVVYINSKPAENYTFKYNYYWMMGDNRDCSADSRFWGFVPEDHIVGKPIFVWLSLDKDRGWFDGKIRWNRLFTIVDNIK